MKKGLWIGTAVLLMFSILLGCSTPQKAVNSAAAGDEGANGAADEKLSISWMATSFQGGGWPDDHPMIKVLDEKFNVDLNIQWVPMANYQEKLNVLAASNEFPDVFTVLPQEFNKWKNEGLFLDVQPVLNEYANLSQIPQDVLSLMNPSGKVLGFPYYITQARDSLSVRKDWLEKLGLAEPQTLDEFYEAAKAFAERDPDGNGLADTSGFTFYLDAASHEFVGIEYIQAAFGLGNKWKEDGGKLIPYQTQVEEWKQTLSFLKKAYEEGVLDKDFVVNKFGAPLEKLESNKVGFAYANPNQYQNSLNAIQKLVPDAVIAPVTPPQGPTGLTGTATLEMLNKIVVNAAIDPVKQKRILEILDYFLSEEGADFIKHGIEGVHYQKDEKGGFIKLEAADKDRQNLINNWIFRPFDPGIQMYKWDDEAGHQAIRDMFEANAKHAWVNPAAGLVSDTHTKLGASLSAKFMDTAANIITGRQPLEAIEQASSDWLAGGGNQIIEEINESYRKS